MVGKSQVIAMATHGYSALQRWLMGSTTQRVLHATTLPLLIVRPPDMSGKGQ
jgi:nucleotide-binding universal stress UspA family protein